jgi:hypothetical protein
MPEPPHIEISTEAPEHGRIEAGVSPSSGSPPFFGSTFPTSWAHHDQRRIAAYFNSVMVPSFNIGFLPKHDDA